MLKVKGDHLRIYHDDELLALHQISEKHGAVIGLPSVRQRSPEQRPRYGHDKGKATRGLVTGTLYPEVYARPLAEYERFAQGDA